MHTALIEVSPPLRGFEECRLAFRANNRLSGSVAISRCGPSLVTSQLVAFPVVQLEPAILIVSGEGETAVNGPGRGRRLVNLKYYLLPGAVLFAPSYHNPS